MQHLPPVAEGTFSMQLHDAHLMQLLTPDELAMYRSLNLDARFVVSHRLRVGDSFDRAKRLLYMLADESGLQDDTSSAY